MKRATWDDNCVSLMGKGSGLSSAAKKKLGSFAIEHETELWKIKNE